VNGLGDGPKAGELPNPVSAIGTAQVARQGTPAEWYRAVSEGNLERFMPPFSSLSVRQRWDVVAYTYSLSMNEEKIAEGAELYSANCAGCHGESGKGDGAAASSLQPTRNFTDLEYMASRSTNDFYTAITQGVEPDMPAFADKMSESERWIRAMGDR
jgi:mono/diheme cytochrome c family protein